MVEHAQGRSDRALVDRVLEGRAEAVDDFLLRMACIPRILSAKNARLGHPLSADELLDLSHDVFSAVWEDLPGFRGHAALETWVYHYCAFNIMNRMRSSRRRLDKPSVEAESIEVAALDPQTLVPEDSAILFEALRRLDPDDVALIQLKQLEGLTFEEIGARLALSSNTVKTRYYRALERLRADLGPSFG